MERKNTMLLTVIAVATLLVAVVGATFAYFTATSKGENSTEIKVTTDSLNSTTSTATGINMTITLEQMKEVNKGQVYSDAAVLTMASSVGTGGGTYACTYDLTYDPNWGGFAGTDKAINTGNETEFTLMGTAAATAGGTLVTDNFAELDLKGITAKETLVDGATFTIVGTKGTTTESTLTWTVTAKFYNRDFDQNDLASSTFGGTLAFENVNCVSTPAA